MNQLTIIGNLVADPKKQVTQSGISVCNIHVAVNRRYRAEGEPQADYFRVAVWRGLADNCAKYLHKGSKVCVSGEVRVSTYQGQDGEVRASLDVVAHDVEFLGGNSGQMQEVSKREEPSQP